MISKQNLEKRRAETNYYNLVCPVCGKKFHRKPCYINKAKWKKEICCSSECNKSIRKVKMSGPGNHQYGIKGSKNSSFLGSVRNRKNQNLRERMVFVGDWYVKNSRSGRVPEHRYLVELNYQEFDLTKFEKIGEWYYLKDGYNIHHIDFNHDNNALDNLLIVTRAEHAKIHNAERRNKNKKLNGTE